MKNLQELSKSEMLEIDGGFPWGPAVAAAALVGAAVSWAWDKGESLGKAMA